MLLKIDPAHSLPDLDVINKEAVMANGLDGVVAAETIMSDVDGAAGRLTIRGHALDAIAGRWSFEEVVALLWDGMFDAPASAADIAAGLGAARVAAFATLSPWLERLPGMALYDAVRVAVALVGDGPVAGEETAIDNALGLVAMPAVALTALIRARAGDAPIAPDPASAHAADVMRMLGAGQRGAGLDGYLVTVADHGLNASTFASRVVASTQAGLGSSVLAGLGALKGPLHGGAPGPVLDMLDAIAADGDATRWLMRAMGEGERLMGFGHRIYKVRDPRADALARIVHAMPQTSGRVAFAQQVEAAALAVLRRHKPGRALDTNVEFYTALLLEALGFPRDAFTAVFAVGRIAGWIAHAREQALTGRLIRPQSRYVGPRPELAA